MLRAITGFFGVWGWFGTCHISFLCRTNPPTNPLAFRTAVLFIAVRPLAGPVDVYTHTTDVPMLAQASCCVCLPPAHAMLERCEAKIQTRLFTQSTHTHRHRASSIARAVARIAVFAAVARCNRHDSPTPSLMACSLSSPSGWHWKQRGQI